MTPATSPGRAGVQAARIGVRIAGTGAYLPDDKITNADLERLMDTSDEWIVQRTGIRERRRIDRAKGESPHFIAATALQRALGEARMEARELDLIIVGTVSGDMNCPSTACRVADLLKATPAAAFDVGAACCGFVFSMGVAHDMIRTGTFRNVGVIGCDVLTPLVEYNTHGRACAVIFGDAAGAAVLRATDDPSRGIIAQAMHADGSGWPNLFIPRNDFDYPPGFDRAQTAIGKMFMNGREVFKFAVGTFNNLIQETLDKAGLTADDVAQFICHQSNYRILEAARERFGLPREKLYVNIDRVGNTSAGSVPVSLDELRRAGRVREGDKVMLVAFGAGLTWGASLWQL